jgi:hypothetical protein
LPVHRPAIHRKGKLTLRFGRGQILHRAVDDYALWGSSGVEEIESRAFINKQLGLGLGNLASFRSLYQASHWETSHNNHLIYILKVIFTLRDRMINHIKVTIINTF